MKYGKVLGLEKPISKIVLGSMGLHVDRQDESNAVLDTYFELGGNACDTAHCYGPGICGAVGQWMESRGVRDRFVVMDKGCHPYGSPRFSPEFIESDLKDNLAALRTDYVDLFVFHRDDPTYPLEPIVEKLNELRDQGKIHGFGGSNWSIERIEEANRIAAEKGLQGFSLNNPNLSLATVNEPMWRDCVTIDLDGRAWHERTQFPLFAWSSVGGGFFTGLDTPDVRRVYWNEENNVRKARLEELAAKKGLKPIQLALAWTLHQPFPVWALIGCRTPGEVRDAVEAVDVELSDAEARWLESGR